MSQMHIGIFLDRTTAEAALSELEAAGYDPKEISIVAKDLETGKTTTTTGDAVAGSAAEGATTGGVIGGLAGLLIGVGVIAIPGVGGLLIGGPIAAALGLTGAAATTVSGAVTGALAGGLVGALVGLGIPEEIAHVYETKIREGGVLLTVPVHEVQDDKARAIMESHGADQLRTITTK